MKVKLYYKKYHLGTLTFQDNAFVYNSNFEQEKLALENHSVAMGFYSLTNSQNKKSNILFSEFDVFMEGAERSDLVARANMKPNDSEFAKLHKLAKLNLEDSEFYITK